MIYKTLITESRDAGGGEGGWAMIVLDYKT